MTKRLVSRFKDTGLDDLYQALVGKTPDKLLELKIWGGIYHAFKKGFDGDAKPLYIVRNTFAYVAFIAGKESRKR